MEASREEQESLMIPEAQKEHRWLEKLVGEWTVDSEGISEPGKQAERFAGAQSVRSIGDLWILAETEGEMPEVGHGVTIMTLGYNPQKQRFVGTFIGSMMTHMWLYDGELDADEKVLTLDSEGPSMTTEGQMAKYRDVIEIKNDDHWTLTSYVLGDDGKWQDFMWANYRRKK